MGRAIGAICLGLVIAVSFLGSERAASAQGVSQFPEELGQTAFLKALTWKSDPTIQEIVSVWTPYSGTQGFAGRTVVSARRVQHLGLEFEAQYRKILTNSHAQLVLLRDGGDEFNRFSGENCRTLLKWADDSFGTPEGKVDIQSQSVIHIQESWRIGDTRASIICFGQYPFGKWMATFMAVNWGHVDDSQPTEDIVLIECSGTRRITSRIGGSFTGTPAPLVLIIDPNSRRLLRRDGLPYLHTDQFSSAGISASKTDEKSTTKMTIDRLTGSYSMAVRSGGENPSELDQWGKCVKIEPGPKF